jgi:hypothetical protein
VRRTHIGFFRTTRASNVSPAIRTLAWPGPYCSSSSPSTAASWWVASPWPIDTPVAAPTEGDEVGVDSRAGGVDVVKSQGDISPCVPAQALAQVAAVGVTPIDASSLLTSPRRRVVVLAVALAAHAAAGGSACVSSGWQNAMCDPKVSSLDET